MRRPSFRRRMLPVVGGLLGCALALALALAPLQAKAGDPAGWPSLDTPAPKAGGGANDSAVIVAIEDYPFLADIPGAKANAMAWYDYLTETADIPVDRVRLVMGQTATKEEVLDAAKAASAKAKVGGRVWFIFIGHGAPSQAGDDGLLVGFDTQQNAKSLEARGIKQSTVLQALDGGQARPVAIIDACFSGRSGGGDALIPGYQPVRIASTQVPASAVVLSAARSDQYAGPLPLANRPAFSYLLLGALRGWGDSDGDGNVTATEAVGYANRVLTTVVHGRTQTPERSGATTKILLASSATESGPDLKALIAATASEVSFGGTTGAKVIAAPRMDMAGLAKARSLSELNIAAEKALEAAILAQQVPEEDRDPEKLRRTWCALADLKGDNPYKDQASAACRDWTDYIADHETLVSSMRSDFKNVQGYVGLQLKTDEEKYAVVVAFNSAYAALDDLQELARAREWQLKYGMATGKDVGEGNKTAKALILQDREDALTAENRRQERLLGAKRVTIGSSVIVGATLVAIATSAAVWRSREKQLEDHPASTGSGDATDCPASPRSVECDALQDRIRKPESATFWLSTIGLPVAAVTLITSGIVYGARKRKARNPQPNLGAWGGPTSAGIQLRGSF